MFTVLWKSPTAAELTFILILVSSVTCLLTQWASLCGKGKLFDWDLLGGGLWLSGGDGGGLALSDPWDSLIRRSTSSESWTGMWELTNVHSHKHMHTYHTHKPLGVHTGQLWVLESSLSIQPNEVPLTKPLTWPPTPDVPDLSDLPE